MFRFTGWRYRFLVPIAVSVAVVVLLGSQFSDYGLSDPQASKSDARSDEPSVIVLRSGSPTRYEFGTLNRGARAEKAFVLHNSGPTAATVSEITTSCECLRVHLAKRTIEPGESTSGTVTVDFRNEPQFAGGLLLRAEGWADGAKAAPAFVIQVGVSVH